MLTIAIIVAALLAYALGFWTSKNYWENRVLCAVTKLAAQKQAQRSKKN